MMVAFEMKENKVSTWITKCASSCKEKSSISIGSLGIGAYRKQTQTCILSAIEFLLYGSTSKGNMNIKCTHLPLK